MNDVPEGRGIQRQAFAEGQKRAQKATKQKNKKKTKHKGKQWAKGDRRERGPFTGRKRLLRGGPVVICAACAPLRHQNDRPRTEEPSAETKNGILRNAAASFGIRWK